jgi:hypothetical protein
LGQLWSCGGELPRDTPRISISVFKLSEVLAFVYVLFRNDIPRVEIGLFALIDAEICKIALLAGRTRVLVVSHLVSVAIEAIEGEV